VGVAPERVLRKGKKDNFWGPAGAEGPCGPCTELHYDLGEEFSCGHPECGIDTCECDRFVEIWNLVFTELYQDEEGNISPLEKKNVDTGMGLERVTMVCNGKASTFETDLLWPILMKTCDITGKKYKENPKTDISLRIITDHTRCVSFMIADGIVPGNEGRNYVLRMILRRALRHGKILGVNRNFLYELVDVVVDNYGDVYPELVENKSKIVDIIQKEEDRFRQTLEKGQTLLDSLITDAIESKTEIKGDDAFKLYDTFGYPLELTIEIAEEKGIKVDKAGFEAAMAEQKRRAKEARKSVNLTDDLVYAQLIDKYEATEFVGYDELISEANVLEVIGEGENLEVILDKTPFYAESGGQVADEGVLVLEKGFDAEVFDVQKFNGVFVHKVKSPHCQIKAGDKVVAKVNSDNRRKITSHHSLAHLLQAALIKVVGNDVKQAGSLVEPDRTRFDFSFDRAVTKDELKKVEALINKWVVESIPCSTDVLDIEEAKKQGAIALFGEKYEDNVRVVSIGAVSKELCGGVHASNTIDLQLVKILSESAISAGTRRIEAVCSDAAISYLNNKAKEFDKIADTFKAQTSEVYSRVEKLLQENKDTNKKLKDLEAKIALSQVDSLLDKTVDIDGGKLLVSRLDGVAPDGLKQAMDKISDKIGSSVVVLASVFDEKIMIMAKISDDLVAKGYNAGKIVNEIASECEGKGGGRPNFAQAGAKNISKLDDALCKFQEKTLK
ncbi:MAG: alanine--tRNA ligase, partial [Candidatus Gastranaerophilales bacterium]|nr:alanine--tRNA ligase [Candidatus Gastranaerophilales bacterium]